jgi:mono/diheme cytochrome c family protein
MSTMDSLRIPRFLLRLACAGILLSFLLPGGPAGAQDEEKPYTIENGKVDEQTFTGYERFMDFCARCHGQFAVGSSFAPSLAESLNRLSYEQFAETVINGKTTNIAGRLSVMPAFGLVEPVALNIDAIYAYLKARADGALPAERPEVQGQ